MKTHIYRNYPFDHSHACFCRDTYLLETGEKDKIPFCQAVPWQFVNSSGGWTGYLCEYAGLEAGGESIGKQIGFGMGRAVWGKPDYFNTHCSLRMVFLPV